LINISVTLHEVNLFILYASISNQFWNYILVFVFLAMSRPGLKYTANFKRQTPERKNINFLKFNVAVSSSGCLGPSGKSKGKFQPRIAHEGS
jgi:hypothetical protein